jgi:hypothetical protein
MIIKLSSRYGDVYVNAATIAWFKHGQTGTIIFFPGDEQSYVEVSDSPETVAKLIAKGAPK